MKGALFLGATLALALLCSCASRTQSAGKPQPNVPAASPVTPEAARLKAPEFVWPLENPSISSYYGWRERKVRVRVTQKASSKKGAPKKRAKRITKTVIQNKMHEGLDLRARKGTPLWAAAAGKVIYASRHIHGFGKMVVIDHGNGWSSVYAHLSKFQVKVGDEVAARDPIGLAGATGHAHGAHLHFEIRKGSDPIDPVVLLPQISHDPAAAEESEEEADQESGA